MPCDYKFNGYCFHPDRATGNLVAINCVYDWVDKKGLEIRSKRLAQESEG